MLFKVSSRCWDYILVSSLESTLGRKQKPTFCDGTANPAGPVAVTSWRGRWRVWRRWFADIFQFFCVASVATVSSLAVGACEWRWGWIINFWSWRKSEFHCNVLKISYIYSWMVFLWFIAMVKPSSFWFNISTMFVKCVK